jgi:hypothetical protein
LSKALFALPIVRFALPRGVMASHITAAQPFMFERASLRGALTPQLKAWALELAAHERNHLRLRQAEAALNRFKRRAVFPGHFYDAAEISCA